MAVIGREVWRIRVGAHGWVRDVDPDGSVTVAETFGEAMSWSTQEEAHAVADRMPASIIRHHLDPGPRTGRDSTDIRQPTSLSAAGYGADGVD